jgi:transketolase
MATTDATAHAVKSDKERVDAAMDQVCVNTIRTLAMDAVQAANSGHPGTPMALAPVVYYLWQRVLRFDPDHPIWPNRDRFVLSVGHASMPTVDRTKYAAAEGVQRGAYVLADPDDGQPDVLLLATGSEVSLCLEAHERLANEGIKARVVSMPSWEIFERYCRDHPEYREQVLPESVAARVSVEKASTLGWARYVGASGQSIGMETFGASAPLAELQKKFGFTPAHIVAAARQQIARAR